MRTRRPAVLAAIALITLLVGCTPTSPPAGPPSTATPADPGPATASALPELPGGLWLSVPALPASAERSDAQVDADGVAYEVWQIRPGFTLRIGREHPLSPLGDDLYASIEAAGGTEIEVMDTGETYSDTLTYPSLGALYLAEADGVPIQRAELYVFTDTWTLTVGAAFGTGQEDAYGDEVNEWFESVELIERPEQGKHPG